MNKLTDKQDAFCREYIKDLNATKAAIRAGYSEKTASEIGFENLRKPQIVDRVCELKEIAFKRNDIEVDRILLEYKRIGFSNVVDYYDLDSEENLKLKKLSELNENHSAAISSIETSETTFGEDGKKTTIKFRLHDKLKGLEALSKYKGLFEKDNEQKKDTSSIIFSDKVQDLLSKSSDDIDS